MLFTSESVTEGHPDKLADQVADAILDAVLEQDPEGRVACEVALKTGFVLLTGEISTRATVDHAEVAREAVRRAGYEGSRWGFDGNTCAVICALSEQSPDIARGVNASPQHEQGAGDQGTMFGYACRETPELMPAPIQLAHRLTRELARLRKSGELEYLGPDGKSQVTVEYDARGERPQRLHTVLVSAQHAVDIDHPRIEGDLRERLLEGLLPAEWVDERTRFLVNPTGRFVVGGPRGDSGLTGRKSIVDTYGGRGRHGGGAFSGKDPSKVDRSAGYLTRAIAKHVVAADLADRCEVQISYAIGLAGPLAVEIDTEGTGRVPAEALARAVRETFALTPRGIIEALDLRRPIYRETSCYGHFGREGASFPWERLDRVAALRTVARTSQS